MSGRANNLFKIWDSLKEGDYITLRIKGKPSVKGQVVKDYSPNVFSVKNKKGLWAYDINNVESIITKV